MSQQTKSVSLPPGLGPMASPSDTARAVNQLIAYLAARDGQVPAPLEYEDLTGDLPVHDTKKYNLRSMDIINQVVWHHVGNATGNPVTPWATARYHVERLEWPGIGYHWFITRDGQIYQTNKLETVSYHCYRECNTISVGVCLDGSFISGRMPTAEQLASGKQLNAYLLHLLPGRLIKQHKEVRRTTCPGSTVDLWWDYLLP